MRVIFIVFWLFLALILISPCGAVMVEVIPQEPLGKDYLNLTSLQDDNTSPYLVDELKFNGKYLNNVSAWLIRGSLQLKTANYTDASRSFTRVVLQDPGNRTAYVGLLQSQLNNGMYDALYSNATKMSRAFPDDPSARLYQGYAMLKKGNNEEAIRIYNSLISAGSEPVAARYYKARAEFALNKYQKSLDLYNETLKMDPGFAAAWSGIGTVRAYGMKDRNASMEAYDKAISLDNRYIYAYFLKAAALIDIFNASNESLLVYGQAVDLDPENPDALCAKASVLIAMNNSMPGQYPMEEVLRLSENATRLAPGYWGGWNNYACALILLNRTEEAIDACKKTAELAPDNCYAKLNLGIVYERIGRYEEAVQVYDQMADCPTPSLVASAMVFKGSSLEALGRYDEALAAYEMAIRLSPSNTMAWQKKGDLLSRNNRYLDARSAYAKASEILLNSQV
jgi:tetratricopeptide (TPR) repeat protein